MNFVLIGKYAVRSFPGNFRIKFQLERVLPYKIEKFISFFVLVLEGSGKGCVQVGHFYSKKKEQNFEIRFLAIRHVTYPKLQTSL
jgi:hypothetical protein